MKKCFECGVSPTQNHHVVPRSKGGTRTIPLCHSCHGKVHGVENRLHLSTLSREAVKRKREAGGHVGGGARFYMISNNDGEHYQPDSGGIVKLGRMIELFNSKAKGKDIAIELEFSPATVSKYKKLWKSGAIQADYDRYSEMNAALTAAR